MSQNETTTNAYRDVSTRFPALPACRTHHLRPVPQSLADNDELPLLTPIVGDRVRYLTVTGIEIHPTGARTAMRRGETVMYDTWEMSRAEVRS